MGTERIARVRDDEVMGKMFVVYAAPASGPRVRLERYNSSSTWSTTGAGILANDDIDIVAMEDSSPPLPLPPPLGEESDRIDD